MAKIHTFFIEILARITSTGEESQRRFRALNRLLARDRSMAFKPNQMPA
jgi:hypothetical protein